MIIELLHTPGCPNATPLINRLRLAEAERPGVSLVVTEVSYDQPPPVGFAGSPTVLLDGINPFDDGTTEAAACALHPPTIEQVEALLEN